MDFFHTYNSTKEDWSCNGTLKSAVKFEVYIIFSFILFIIYSESNLLSSKVSISTTKGLW